MPLANSAVLAAHLPHARLFIVDRWGHYLLHDRDSGAGRAVAGFLAADDWAESEAWQDGHRVGAAELAEFVKPRPRSAHPSRYSNGMVRWLYPLRAGVK